MSAPPVTRIAFSDCGDDIALNCSKICRASSLQICELATKKQRIIMMPFDIPSRRKNHSKYPNWIFRPFLQYWNGESHSLSRAGPATPDAVPPFQYLGYTSFL